MQKLSTLIITLMTLCATTFATNTVIVNPVYEFRNIGFKYISKIELNENETRLHVQATFIPYTSWVSFSNDAYIEDDATGERWQVNRVIDIEFNERIYMPASGDYAFVLVFPPLPPSVSKINLTNFSPIIFGISLNPETQPRNREIPDEVLQWIDSELANARRQTLMNFAAGEFFANDTARLVGYIRGYDRRSGLYSGMIHLTNEITREAHPTILQIHEDGRFEASLPISYPMLLWMRLNNHLPQFYIQPGQTLAMLLDWDDFLMADRRRNHSYLQRNIRYLGATADINSELSAIQLPPISNVVGWEKSEGSTPLEYKLAIDEFMAEHFENYLRHVLENEDISERTRNLLWNDFLLTHKALLLDFDMSYRDAIPLEFYDFLQNVPMNNKELLSSGRFSWFINRLEFSQPFFMGARMEAARSLMRQPEKTFEQYLFEVLNIPKTPEDKVFVALENYRDSIMAPFGNVITRERVEFMEQHAEFFEKFAAANEEFMERHEHHFDAYLEKYVHSLSQPTGADIELRRWEIQDFIYTYALNLESGIVYDIIKIRALSSRFQNMSVHSKEDNLNLLMGLAPNITEPFLRQEAARLFIRHFPAPQRVGEELPDTYAGNIFREIIAPFEGKMVVVNFWATTCAPCIASIREQKALRERYKDSSDVAFIFITSERASPLNAYRDFVNEQELTHSFRIPDNQYNHLAQLFRMSGFPHYVLVDRQGRILNDNFRNARMLNVSAPLLQQLSN